MNNVNEPTNQQTNKQTNKHNGSQYRDYDGVKISPADEDDDGCSNDTDKRDAADYVQPCRTRVKLDLYIQPTSASLTVSYRDYKVSVGVINN